MEPEWQDMLDGIIADERSHIPDLAGWISETEDKAKNIDEAWTKVHDRIDLWVNRYADVRNQAKIMTAEDKDKYEWVLGATEQHCVTCAGLNGIVATAKMWQDADVKPQSPPNGYLSCGGWKCDCSLEPTNKRRSTNAYDRIIAVVLGGPDEKHAHKGGEGSGNFDHAGRPGEVGGSGPGGGGSDSGEGGSDGGGEGGSDGGGGGGEVENVRPGDVNPVNDVTNMNKMYAISEDMSTNGFQGEAILAYDAGGYYQAVTGSHRIYAAREAGLEKIPVHVMDTSKWSEEDIDEFNGLNEDEDRASFIQKMADRGKADQESARIMKTEVKNNYDNVMVDYTQAANQHIINKYNHQTTEKPKQETIHASGETRREYNQFLNEMRNKYSNPYADMSDSEMEKLEKLERNATKSAGSQPHLHKYGENKDVTVWIVDGQYVRDNIFIDFVSGGNHERYNFVPSGEIWIDNDNEDEAGFILLHELIESSLMRGGADYEMAHNAANASETRARRVPAELAPMLKQEGWTV